MKTTAKRASARKTAKAVTSPASVREQDPRVANLLSALRADAKLLPVVEDFEKNRVQSGRKFGSNGLKVGGKLFALFTQGALVVKLPGERVAALVASKIGTRFDPGHGRLMQEWLTVTSPRASWTELAKEAFEFVKGSTRA